MEAEKGSKNQVVLHKSDGFTAGGKKRYFGLREVMQRGCCEQGQRLDKGERNFIGLEELHMNL